MSPFNAKRQDCGRYKLLPQITALNITLEKTEEICLAAEKAEEDMSRLEKDKKVQSIQHLSQQNQSSRTNYCPRQSPQNSRQPSTSNNISIKQLIQ